MKNYFKGLACLLTLMFIGSSMHAQLGNDERMIKDISFRLSLRPSFSTIPANSWFEIYQELNILPIVIETPIKGSRFSLRFSPIVGISENLETNDNWWGGWWGNNIIPNHIKENVPPSLFKSFGAEFSILTYFEKGQEAELLSGYYVSANFGFAYHPRYYYQSYKLAIEMGYNWVSENNDVCYGLALEIGGRFRNSYMNLNKQYRNNLPFLMPRLSVGYVIK